MICARVSEVAHGDAFLGLLLRGLRGVSERRLGRLEIRKTATPIEIGDSQGRRDRAMVLRSGL